MCHITWMASKLPWAWTEAKKKQRKRSKVLKIILAFRKALAGIWSKEDVNVNWQFDAEVALLFIHRYVDGKSNNDSFAYKTDLQALHDETSHVHSSIINVNYFVPNDHFSTKMYALIAKLLPIS